MICSCLHGSVNDGESCWAQTPLELETEPAVRGAHFLLREVASGGLGTALDGVVRECFSERVTEFVLRPDDSPVIFLGSVLPPLVALFIPLSIHPSTHPFGHHGASLTLHLVIQPGIATLRHLHPPLVYLSPIHSLAHFLSGLNPACQPLTHPSVHPVMHLPVHPCIHLSVHAHSTHLLFPPPACCSHLPLPPSFLL